MSFTPSQTYGMDILKSGRNVFLTGDAGTGKSYLLNEYISYNEKNKINMMVVAPTGIAAININGTTIHRAFKAPIEPIVEPPKSVRVIVKEADVIIIDEISMCRIDLFDFCMKQIVVANIARRKAGKKDIQIVVCGDFFQLPPVLKEADERVLSQLYPELGRGFAFKSKYWDICNFCVVLLKDVVRQTDLRFSTILNEVRLGNKSCISYIEKGASKEEIYEAITLCGTNKQANKINDTEYNKIDDREKIYYSEIKGEIQESDKMVPDELKLKIGVRVMTLVNDYKGRYSNGSFGTVTGFGNERVYVDMDNGNSVIVEPYTWSINDYNIKDGKLEKESIGSYTQIPLRICYAITIHKSQGQTYDGVNLEPYCWEYGQLYVALSRVISLDKLYLVDKIQPRFLKASREVKEFYRKLELKQKQEQAQLV